MSSLVVLNAVPSWKDKTCKNCSFFTDIPGQQKVLAGAPTIKECRKNPPGTIALLQQGKMGNLQTTLTVAYPRMPETFHACSFHQEKITT